MEKWGGRCATAGFGLKEFRHFARWLTDLELQTDKGSFLATWLIQQVREERIVLPPQTFLRCNLSKSFIFWKILLAYHSTSAVLFTPIRRHADTVVIFGCGSAALSLCACAKGVPY